MNTKNLVILVVIMTKFTLVFDIYPDFYLFVDLNGVLVKNSKIKAFKKLGIEALGNPHLKDRLFEFMNYIDEEPDNTDIYFQGKKFPTFLCEWQRGNLTCQEITDFIITCADKNRSFFKSKTEQKLIKKIAEFFLPKKNVEVSKPSTSMINLVKKLKNKKSKHKYEVFLTTNFDTQTFAEIKKAFPEIVNLFDKDKIIISGKIGYIKPEYEFYDYIVKKFNLNPNNCCLIDDTIENVEGAKKYGIKGIQYKNTSQVMRDLKKINFL